MLKLKAQRIENATINIPVYQRSALDGIFITGIYHTIKVSNSGMTEIYAAIEASIHKPIIKLLPISVIAIPLSFSVNARRKIRRSRKKNKIQKEK